MFLTRRNQRSSARSVERTACGAKRPVEQADKFEGERRRRRPSAPRQQLARRRRSERAALLAASQGRARHKAQQLLGATPSPRGHSPRPSSGQVAQQAAVGVGQGAHHDQKRPGEQRPQLSAQCASTVSMYLYSSHFHLFSLCQLVRLVCLCTLLGFGVLIWLLSVLC